jgi:Na+/H+ antiporter NhaD/arsenite permease-like protein
MKQNKRIIVSIMWVIIGMVLIGLSFAGIVDTFWNGMGSGLLVVGIIQLIRFYRLQKNEAYREKMEIEASDERNHFIRNKAWAWAGYLFIFICALSTIVFKLFGQDLLCMVCSGAVCLMLVLFWVCLFILKKKY